MHLIYVNFTSLHIILQKHTIFLHLIFYPNKYRERERERERTWMYVCKREKEREGERENLNGRGNLGNKRGFLKWVRRVDMKKRSPQSSFCSSETTKACPNPSTSPGFCQNFFFSSIGRLKNSCVSAFTFSTNEELTPWFINCDQLIYLLWCQKIVWICLRKLTTCFKFHFYPEITLINCNVLWPNFVYYNVFLEFRSFSGK